MIPRPVYVLPGQAVIFERGPSQGNPLANAVFSTGWFDVYQVQPGQIVAPQTGALVDATSEAITGVGTVANVAAYYLDLFIEHDNANRASLIASVEGQIAQALQAGGPPVMNLCELVVPTQDAASGQTRPYTSRVVVQCRFARVTIAYPNVNSVRFNMSAVLRAA